MKDTFTTLAPLARIAVETMQSYGIDAISVMQAEDFDVSILDNPDGRFSATSMRRVLTKAADLAADPAFGIRAAEYFRPGCANAFGLAWFTSHSLRHAFRRLDRYDRFLSNAASVRFDDRTYEPFLEIHDELDDGARPEALDIFIAIIVKLARAAYGDSFSPVRCELQRTMPQNPEIFEEHFGCPIAYGAGANLIYLKNDDLDKFLVGSNNSLAQQGDRVIERYLASMDRDDYVLQVRVNITKLLPSGEVSEKVVAESLNVSPRTLQRKLREQGTNFQELLKGTRYELAAQHLRYSKYSVTETAYLLGYENTGNFSRAFKSWTGKTPTQYRTEK